MSTFLRFLCVALIATEQVQALQIRPACQLASGSVLSASSPLRQPAPVMEKLTKEQEARMKAVGSDSNFGQYRRIESAIYLVGGLITLITPIVLGIWAYNEGYLTPQ
eukprot:scaffold140513_cov39-Tisochrysis_lutea.AAC.1